MTSREQALREAADQFHEIVSSIAEVLWNEGPE